MQPCSEVRHAVSAWLTSVPSRGRDAPLLALGVLGTATKGSTGNAWEFRKRVSGVKTLCAFAPSSKGSCPTHSHHALLMLHGHPLRKPRGRSGVRRLLARLSCSSRVRVSASWCVAFWRRASRALCLFTQRRNLVDPASSHTLVSKIKPCMSKYKHLYRETANGSLYQL